MAETSRLTRRLYLLAAIQRHGAPVTTQTAVNLMRPSPWATTGRNTTRKDLRALTALGYLAEISTADGRCAYRLPTLSFPESMS